MWIYPPKAERAAALASADPERVTERPRLHATRAALRDKGAQPAGT